MLTECGDVRILDFGAAAAIDPEQTVSTVTAQSAAGTLAYLAPERLLARMRLDKKNLAGRLRLVLWRGLGRAEVVPDVDESRVLAVLSG